jgi:hypothetical protein
MQDANIPTSGNSGVSVSRTEEMLNALKNGAAGFSDNDTSTQETSEPVVEASANLEAEVNSDVNTETVESDTEGETATSENEEGEATQSLDSANKKADIEEIVVTGPEGKKRLKIDYTDKDKIKTAFKLAAGARKWQKERDDARKTLTEVKAEKEKADSDWQRLETAYKEDGIRGLVNLLEGKDVYSDFLDQEIQKKREYDALSPQQKEALDLRKQSEKDKLEAAKVRTDYEKKLAEINKKQQEAEAAALNSKVTPAFEKYSFSGKLGDPVSEAEFDEMLWNKAIANLEKIPESIELTKAMIDKEFRMVSQRMQKHLNSQVQKKVTQVIDKTKQAATSKAQAQVRKGLTKPSEMDEVRKQARGGDLVGSLSSFFNLGGKAK